MGIASPWPATLRADGSAAGGGGDGSGGGAFSILAVLHEEQKLAGPHDIELNGKGDLAYVAGKFGSFAIVDVSDPANPRLRGTITEGVENAQTVLPMGRGICLLGTNDLLAVDVNDPDRPRITKRIAHPTIDRINGMARRGRHVLAANKSGYVDVFDVSEPANPQFVGALNTRQRGNIISPHDIVAFRDRIIIVDQRTGSPLKLRIYRVAPAPNRPLWPIERWKLEGAVRGEDMDGANRVVVLGRHAYVACNYAHTLAVIDMSESRSPEKIAVVPTAGREPDGLCRSGEALFIGAAKTVQAMDISDPRAPRSLGHCDCAAAVFPDSGPESADAHDLVVRDGLVCVTAQASDRLGVLRFERDGSGA